MSDLPASIHDLVQMEPMEDLILTVLRQRITDVPIGSLIAENTRFPFVMIRCNGDWGNWNGDPRFIDTAQLMVQVYCDGLNADEDAALLSEAVRVVLTDAINKVIPGRGHLTHVVMVARPRRVADWASSTGPVQYADLPSGVIRYETIYEIAARRPL